MDDQQTDEQGPEDDRDHMEARLDLDGPLVGVLFQMACGFAALQEVD
ncbi:hypothetical protein C5167_032524 [Papaver somniferum]|uniref:Uncharacterized protein n=1 Tax=Papaver somniferum TaxID=3469 RepID=A0A4Y7KBV7_PAPSO|nr:hypothetical protein C5167_032524 [Papaver somniferum]